MTVNDPDGIGVVGDAKLSLAEAIQLTNGSLSLNRLSQGERRQVTGRPGRASGDLVRTAVPRITVPSGSTPTVPGIGHETVPSQLPTLEGNEGDVFDGGGAVLSNGPDGGPISGLALRITSSDFTLTGWVIRQYYNAVDAKAPDASGLHDLTLRGNRLEVGGGIFVDAVAASGELTTVRHFNVLDNAILGAPVFGRTHPAPIYTLPVLVVGLADYDPDLKPTATGRAVVEDVLIKGNTIRGYGTGGSISAVSSTQPTPSSNARMSHLRVLDNDVEGTKGGTDPGFMIWASANLSGEVSDVRLSDVVVSNNRFAGGAVAFYAAVAEHVFGGGETEDVAWDGLTFTGNRLESLGNCQIGAMFTSAFQELGGGIVTDTHLTKTTITGNTVRGCATGVLLTPTVFQAGVGLTRGSDITGAVVSKNAITGAVNGIIAAGATVMGSPLLPTSTPASVATANTLASLLISDNRIEASGTGIRLHGGIAEQAPGALITGNTLGPARAVGNTVTGGKPCIATADDMDTSGAVSVGNTLDRVVCA